ATVHVREGGELAPTVAALLDASGLAIPPGATVAIKATFMLVTHPADPSPGVSPQVLAHVARWCKDRGAGRVCIIDARNLYDRFHGNRDVQAVARTLGITGGDIVDAQDDQVTHPYVRGLGVDTICKTWRDA